MSRRTQIADTQMPEQTTPQINHTGICGRIHQGTEAAE
jgi:hypothetical protein